MLKSYYMLHYMPTTCSITCSITCHYMQHNPITCQLHAQLHDSLHTQLPTITCIAWHEPMITCFLEDSRRRLRRLMRGLLERILFSRGLIQVQHDAYLSESIPQKKKPEDASCLPFLNASFHLLKQFKWCHYQIRDQIQHCGRQCRGVKVLIHACSSIPPNIEDMATFIYLV